MPAAAKYLGLTPAGLFQKLASGQSLAKVAKAQGKSASGLQSAMVAALKSRLDRLVADKRMTSAQEKQILSQATSGIGRAINSAPSTRPFWPHGAAAPPGARRFFRFGGSSGSGSAVAPSAPLPARRGGTAGVIAAA